MNTCTNPNCRQNNLKVNLGPFARDERLPMVERVLGLLVESRYGLDRKSELLPEFGNAGPIMPDVFDLFPQPFPVPGCSASSVSLLNWRERKQDNNRQSGRRACPRDLPAGILLKTSPSTLGRGSPTKKSGAKPTFLTANC